MFMIVAGKWLMQNKQLWVSVANLNFALFFMLNVDENILDTSSMICLKTYNHSLHLFLQKLRSLSN